jgi:hypothetical protein
MTEPHGRWFPAWLVLAGVLMAACAGTRPGKPWVAEFAFDDPGFGRPRAALWLEIEEGAALAGGSRRGALSAVTGQTLVRSYELFHPSHGSLVEVVESSPVVQGEPLVVELATPLGKLRLRGGFQASLYRGRWSGSLGGGAFAWRPRSLGRDPREPLEDYPALLDAFVAELERRFVFPARLARPAWRAELAAARERAAFLCDDFEFIGLVQRLCEPLGPSTLCLPAAAKPAATRVKLAFEGDVGVLRLAPIADGVAAIDAAFADAAGARALVLDLRGSTGYDPSVGRLAAHLAERSEPVGYMLGRRHADAGPLDEEDRDALPQVAGVTSETLYRLSLTTHGAAAAVSSVRADRFKGPVVVLIDGGTRGGVEPLVEYLQRSGRARLVGEPTAGGPLDVDFAELPGGWTALVPVATWVTWEGRWMEGVPVEPDVRTNSEGALERALALLGSGA